jgi:hypothetical protein
MACYLSFIEKSGKCVPNIASSRISNLLKVRKELQWWLSIIRWYGTEEFADEIIFHMNDLRVYERPKKFTPSYLVDIVVPS